MAALGSWTPEHCDEFEASLGNSKCGQLELHSKMVLKKRGGKVEEDTTNMRKVYQMLK